MATLQRVLYKSDCRVVKYYIHVGVFGREDFRLSNRERKNGLIFKFCNAFKLGINLFMNSKKTKLKRI
jgi:hypothetical protein